MTHIHYPVYSSFRIRTKSISSVLSCLLISDYEHLFYITFSSKNCKLLYTAGKGSITQARTLEKSSAQKCQKEARKFRPDMLAKNNVHVPLRYDKIKTKKVKKKEDISKRKWIKLKK